MRIAIATLLAAALSCSSLAACTSHPTQSAWSPGLPTASVTPGSRITSPTADGTSTSIQASTSVRTKPASSSTPAGPVTNRFVVRPVTTDGHAAPGYTVSPASGTVGVPDCRFNDPSPPALNADIFSCSPTAAGAFACWRSSDAGHVLCIYDPRSHVLADYRVTGPIRATAAPRTPSPMLITLADGSACFIREGGAWASPQSHPNWFGYYSCGAGAKKVVYGPGSGPVIAGIDRSNSTWTVEVGAADGTGQLTVMRVKDAYYLATYRAT